MRFKQLGFIGLMGLALVGCDKATKTPTQTTSIKAREPVIAIALGGGGAKGFAHIGVLKVLESHGIKPKIVTGTSAGSFVGSIYASGKSPYQMQQIAQQLKESDLRDLTLNSQGIVLGQNYKTISIAMLPINQSSNSLFALLLLQLAWIMVKKLNLLKVMQVRPFAHRVVFPMSLYLQRLGM